MPCGRTPPSGPRASVTERAMPAPLYTIPGTAIAAEPPAPEEAAAAPRTVAEVLARTQVEAVLDELDRDLIGLAPVKQRLREIAALLVIDRLRAQVRSEEHTSELQSPLT